jgi:hypothetical protein
MGGEMTLRKIRPAPGSGLTMSKLRRRSNNSSGGAIAENENSFSVIFWQRSIPWELLLPGNRAIFDAVWGVLRNSKICAFFLKISLVVSVKFFTVS